MTLFMEVVESKIEDPHGRLTRFIKYTTGEAKELTSTALSNQPVKGMRMLSIFYEEDLETNTPY